MTPWSSPRQNKVNRYFTTSTIRIHTFNSQLKNPHNKAHYPSWTFLQHNSLQKANPYRPISSLGQQSSHNSQSVYNTLAHRAKMVSSNQHILHKELQHIRKALQACQFPNWALNLLHQKCLKNNESNNNTRDNNNTNQDNNNINNTKLRNITIVVPYIKETCEKFKRLCKSKGIHIYFKGTNTLRTQLVNPKDKDPKLQKSGTIYHYKCPHLNCPEAYIGKSGRALGDGVSEHLKAPSPGLHPQHIYRTSIGP